MLETQNTLFDVTGALITEGTPGAPVVIRPNMRNFQCGDERGWWEGIRGGESGYIELNTTELWYAKNAVRLRDLSNADIEDCTIRCSGDNGVLHEGFGSLVIAGSEVSNGNGNGISIEALTALPDSVYVGHCHLAFNGGSGLRVNIDDQAQTVPIDVEYTKFEFNFVRAVTLVNASFPRLHFNHFTGNGVGTGGSNQVANIYLENGYPNGVSRPELDMTCNYWGAPVSNQSTIDATIRDSLDSGSVGTRVITSPWLNQDPLVVPPVCAPPSP